MGLLDICVQVIFRFFVGWIHCIILFMASLEPNFLSGEVNVG